MPEGHTLFALARDLDAAYRGTAPTATSPQGKFEAGAALVSGRAFSIPVSGKSRASGVFGYFAIHSW